MSGYVIIDGQRVTQQVAADYLLLKAAFEEAFPGLSLRISSGVRTWKQQYDLWYAYAVAKTSKIRAAHPNDPKAFHVETNPVGQRAIDIRDTGADQGVTYYGNARSDWIRDNARRFNFDPAGYDHYDEPWHLEHTGAASPAGSSRPSATEDEQLIQEVIMAMPMLIRDPAGSIFIIDEKGSEHLADVNIKTPDIDIVELVAAATIIYGKPRDVTDRERDVIRAIADRRGRQ